jgi:protein pelota
MEVRQSDFKTGKVKIKITDLDDLWYISHLIDPGDLVRGKTTRKIKIGEGENVKMSKKTLLLTIDAETIDFSEQAVRVNGKITEGPEDIPKGSYHAIALEEGSEFTLIKPEWMLYQKQKLEEAKQKKVNYIICLFDREEALFAKTKKFGYEVLDTLKGEVAKKSKTVEVKKNFQLEIIKILKEYQQRYAPEQIILASPAFFKEDLFKQIKDTELKKIIVLAGCSDISEKSLDEVWKRPELAPLLKDSRARKEQVIMEELLQEIEKKNLAAYGKKQVSEAIAAGAVRALLITDEFIRRCREEGKYEKLDEEMKHVDTLKGKIHILSTEFESGRQLSGLGGIAALLRYKLEW